MKRIISVTINDVTNKQFKFDNLTSLYSFAKKESEYWISASEHYKNPNNNHVYLNSGPYFKSLVTLIDGWKDNLKDWDDTQINSQINVSQRTLLNNIRGNWLWSGHAYVDVFLGINKKYSAEGAKSFFSFVENGNTNITNKKEGFIGSLLAYEFELQGSDLTKRRNSEKVSLEHLRNTMEETNRALTGEIDELKDNFVNWDSDCRSEWRSWVEKIHSEYSTEKLSQKSSHDAQLKIYEKEFDEYFNECKNRIIELEDTYQEKLRLEKPAAYWSNSASKYGRHGALWVIALTASILLGLAYSYNFFDAWLKGQETAVKLNTLQGAVIFGSILAIYAFLVKTLAKLVFSSFHLMRDSEEREQLTYLYLSLNFEGELDNSSREIILNALFSRSETGLLSGDSSPTLPVNDLLKSALKPKP